MNPFDQGQVDPAIEALFLGQANAANAKDYLKEVGAIISDRGTDPELAKQKAVNAGDVYIEKEAERMLQSFSLDVDTARSMGERLGKGEYEDSVSGMYNQLANAEEQAVGKEVIKKELEKDTNLSRYEMHMNLARNAVVSSQENQGLLANVGQAAEFLFSPAYGTTVVNSVRAVFPEAGDITDYANMGQVIDYAAQQIVNAESPEEAERLTRALIGEFRSRAGDLTDNAYALESMLDDLDLRVKTRAKGDVNTIRNFVDDVFGILEYVGLGGTARTVAKGVGKKVIDNLGIEMVQGSPAQIASLTEEGQRRLFDSMDDIDRMFEIGTRAEDVTGSLILPKTSPVPPSSAPYTYPLLDEASQQALTEVSRKAVAIQTFGVRLHDTVINPVEDGIEYSMRLGTKNGKPFKNAERLERELDLFGMPKGSYEIEKVEGGFIASIKGKDTYSNDTLLPMSELDIKGGRWAALFGKGLQFSDRLVKSSNVAALRSAKEEETLKQIIQPFEKLWGKKRAAVAEVLQEGDTQGKTFTRSELVARGFDQSQVLAYNAVRDAADRTLLLKNETVRMRLQDEGWNAFKTKGGKEFLVRRVEEGFVPNRVLDVDTGSIVSNSSKQAEKYDYFQVKGDGVGAQYARIPKGESLSPLPKRIIGKVPGYLPRFYTAPAFVRKRMADGSTRAMYTANSIDEAERVAKDLADETGEEFFAIRSSNLQEQARTFDELEELDAQGLLWTSERKEVLRNFDGTMSGLMGPEAAIRGIVSSGSANAGITRWTIAARKMWENGFPEFKQFDMLNPPVRPDSMTEEKYKAAKRLWDFINMVNGTHPSQAGLLSQAVKNDIYDFFAGIGKTGSKLNNASQYVGREISGQTQNVANIGKSFAFAAYLGLNPFRQALLQMTMIPMYVGAEGGLSYAASGKFARDFLILSGAPLGLDVAKTARQLGMDVKEAQTLVKAYNESGLNQLISNHAFTIGSLSDATVTRSNVVTQGIGRFVDTVKGYGFDVGLKADKRGSFLVSYNRFKVQEGRTPTTKQDFEKVAAFAEQLSLNQNRSDQLPYTQGVLGILTQFMSHQFKMTGRLMGAFGGPIEQGFSRAEIQRMAIASLLTWGVGGYGAWNVYDRFLQENGIDTNNMDPTVRNALRDGIGGLMIDTVLSVADNPDQYTDLDTSAFAPTNAGFVGITPDSLLKLFDGTKKLGNLGDYVSLNAPALALPEMIVKPLTLGYKMYRTTNVEAPEIALRTAVETLKGFPLFNQSYRGIIGLEIGSKLDSRGNPVLEATKGELVGYLLTGLPSAKESDLRVAQARFFGEYSGMDNAGLSKKVKEAATDYATTVLMPLLQGFEAGEQTIDRIIEVVDAVNALNYYSLSEINRDAFYETVFNVVEKSGVTKTDQFRDRLFDATFSDSVIPNGNLLDTIRDAPITDDEKRILTEQLERMRAYK